MKTNISAVITAVCILIGLMSHEKLYAQTTLTSPQIAACPSPVPPTWPAATCKYNFYPSTNIPQAVASGSVATPVYSHTFSGYAPTPAVKIVVCPAGATVSADKTKCTNAAGANAAALVPFSTLSAPATVKSGNFKLTWSAPTKNVDGTAISGAVTYNMQHGSTLTGPWDATTATGLTALNYVYKNLPITLQQCFQVSATVTASGMTATSAPTGVCAPANSVPVAIGTPGAVGSMQVTITANP